jgi:hypothetical protein
VARQMIESLWLLARNRYAGGPPPVKLERARIGGSGLG